MPFDSYTLITAKQFYATQNIPLSGYEVEQELQSPHSITRAQLGLWSRRQQFEMQLRTQNIQESIIEQRNQLAALLASNKKYEVLTGRSGIDQQTLLLIQQQANDINQKIDKLQDLNQQHEIIFERINSINRDFSQRWTEQKTNQANQVTEYLINEHPDLNLTEEFQTNLASHLHKKTYIDADHIHHLEQYGLNASDDKTILIIADYLHQELSPEKAQEVIPQLKSSATFQELASQINRTDQQLLSDYQQALEQEREQLLVIEKAQKEMLASIESTLQSSRGLTTSQQEKLDHTVKSLESRKLMESNLQTPAQEQQQQLTTPSAQRGG
ncbi:MAG: hypothetical protein Tsb005_08520 [Gammaproteobacteria bacterium]